MQAATNGPSANRTDQLTDGSFRWKTEIGGGRDLINRMHTQHTKLVSRKINDFLFDLMFYVYSFSFWNCNLILTWFFPRFPPICLVSLLVHQIVQIKMETIKKDHFHAETKTILMEII